MNVTNINNYNTHQQKLFGSLQLFLGVYRVLWQKKSLKLFLEGIEEMVQKLWMSGE